MIIFFQVECLMQAKNNEEAVIDAKTMDMADIL
jgi:hypothetical protein